VRRDGVFACDCREIRTVIDLGLDVQPAVELPHRCHPGRGDRARSEHGGPASLERALAARVHLVKVPDTNSALFAVALEDHDDGHILSGAADPRRGRGLSRAVEPAALRAP